MHFFSVPLGKIIWPIWARRKKRGKGGGGAHFIKKRLPRYVIGATKGGWASGTIKGAEEGEGGAGAFVFKCLKKAGNTLRGVQGGAPGKEVSFCEAIGFSLKQKFVLVCFNITNNKHSRAPHFCFWPNLTFGVKKFFSKKKPTF